MARPNWIGYKLGGRYEIQEELGQGGMATVYKALDPNLQRVVAVKLIHPHLSSNADFVRRFEAEAAAVAKFRHPNIVQVYDFNHDDGTYYIVFEFVPGESLQDRLKRMAVNKRPFEIGEVIDIVAGVADALDYAHKQGVVHRDIKPANVMLNVFGQPILMDFGIVKMVGSTQHTVTGAVVGTARYMSPEQIKGVVLDGRSDIYSLGVMLFEMVSGRAPYDADSAMTLMMMHLSDPIPNVQSLRADTPAALVGIINKALAKDSNDRFQTAGQLMSALQSLKGGTATVVAAPDMTVVEPPLVVAPPTKKALPVRQAAPPEATTVEPVTGRSRTKVDKPTAPVRQTAVAPQTASSATATPANIYRNWLIMGVLLLALGLIVGIVFGGGLLGGGGDETPTAIVAANGGEATAVDIVAQDPTHTPPPAATNALPAADAPTATTAPLPSDTPPPINTATVEAPPTVANTPEPGVQIREITLDNNYYIVSYITLGYTEQLPGLHIHFFFNDITPENAGVGGSGPWYVWGGPRPFDGFTVNDRPASATQMCAIVANADHVGRPATGNCVNLP